MFPGTLFLGKKKLKLTNRRKLSKMLLFMDIAELFQGPQISGSAKFHLPGIGELKKTARNLGGQVTRGSRGIPNFQIPCFGVKIEI